MRAIRTPITDRFYPRLREGGDFLLKPRIEHLFRFYPRLREGGDGEATGNG